MLENSDNSDQESAYLPYAFRRGCAAFLWRDIIPCISGETDRKSDQTNWIGAVSFAMVLGVLTKLAKKYPKDVEQFFEQAERLVKDFAIQDRKDYPEDCLRDRQQRWIDELKELPRVPKTKKSRLTGQFPPHKLLELIEFENVRETLKTLSVNDKASYQKDDFRKAFPFLSDEDIEGFIEEINYGSKIEEVALSIMAKKIDLAEEYLKRRLSGAKKMAKELDEALKYRDPI